MPVIVALIACALLVGLASFHALLLSGKPWGRFVFGGDHDLLPDRLRQGSGLAIAIYLLFVLITLQGVGLISPFSELVGIIAMWVIPVAFFANFVMNARSRSRSEQLVSGPINLVLAALTLIVAITGRVPLN
ncbi:MAG TPA: hypothetical protein VGP24_16690 [Glaciihabitans sp.]|jgi:hypothetical protein|nr:hypothetical protein [Glaciihabitans sp.]